MKIVFYVLAVAVALLAVLSLLRGIEEYVVGNGFQVVEFGVAVVGILLAGIWFKRARST
jgi:NADH:ubiquinone oxidoreductase subunit 6 (subunit J)